MQKYYTLEEAARVLRTTPDQLRDMAKRNQVRAFQDRGNLRFRSAEIDELARERGLGSEPDLPLGEAGLGDAVPLGEEPRKGSSRRKGPRTPSSPPPKAASDSDVRLVDETSDLNFSIHEEPPADQPPESSVRLVGLDDSADSDVKLEKGAEARRPKSASDSDIRLDEKVARRREPERSDDALVTEEIDLDAEEARARAETSSRKGPGSKARLTPPSPFELSESDLGAPPAAGKGEPGSGINLGEPSDRGISLEQGGSEQLEFDEGLVPAESPDTDSSSDFELSLDDDSLKTADDSSSEFELSLDEESLQTADDSDSEFELSLDPDSPAATDESSSEFELSLDSEEVDSSSDFELEPVAGEDSDSEFELTLDEEGGLGVEEERDIFETDLSIPSGASGSEAVALEDVDAGLEDSDFDLDVAEGEESVVDVGEDAEAGAATVAQQRRRRPRREEEEDLDVEAAPSLAVEEEEEEEEAVAPAAAPASWGPLPAIFLIPTVIVLFLVGLMSFEMIHGMWGYKKSSPVGSLLVHKLAKQFDDSLPE